MKIAEHLQHKIEVLKVNFMLLGNMSAADAEAKAVAQVKAEEAAKPKPQPDATAPAPNKVNQPVDAQTKADADFVRNALLRDFDPSLITDWDEYDDERLRRFAEESGIS
jgi:hypothetical protein